MFQVPAGVGEFTSIRDDADFRKHVEEVLKGEREEFDKKAYLTAKDQINRYFRKELVVRHRGLKQPKNQTPEKVQPLLDLLLDLDRLGPQLNIWHENPDELLPVLYMMPIYSDSQFTLTNQPLDKLRVWPHDLLVERLKTVESWAAKVNIATNNIIMQCCFAVSSADRFIQDTIVRNVNDEMIADSSMKNNKSISRSMIVMGTMFKNAKPELQYTYGA